MNFKFQITAWYVAAIVMCAAGMGTKEVMATAPLLALLYDRTFVAGSFAKALRRRWRLYLGLAATWLILLALVASGPRSESAGFSLQQVSAWQYARSQPAIILHYLRLCVWPRPLVLDYGWSVAESFREIALPSVAILAMLLTVVWAIRYRPAWGFLGMWFFLILAPTSSIIPVGDLAVEHRMYLPLAAVCALFVLLGDRLLERIFHALPIAAHRQGTVKTGLIAGIAIALGMATVDRNRDYHSAVGFWRDVVAKRPNHSRVYLNLGLALLEAGQTDQGAIVKSR